MSGLILIVSSVLFVVFLVLAFIDDYNDDAWGTASFAMFFVALLWLLAVPISRIDSKTNAEYVKVLQETIDKNRENPKEFDVLERTSIMEEINTCNMQISTWKVKGQKWYNNKWYYHPSTQDAEYIK